MVGTNVYRSGDASQADRLSRVAGMVTDAVRLLEQAMEEIRKERENPDERDAPSAPERDPEQPG